MRFEVDEEKCRGEDEGKGCGGVSPQEEKREKKQVWAESCWFYDSRMGYEWTDKHPCVINDGTLQKIFNQGYY